MFHHFPLFLGGRSNPYQCHRWHPKVQAFKQIRLRLVSASITTWSSVGHTHFQPRPVFVGKKTPTIPGAHACPPDIRLSFTVLTPRFAGSCWPFLLPTFLATFEQRLQVLSGWAVEQLLTSLAWWYCTPYLARSQSFRKVRSEWKYMKSWNVNYLLNLWGFLISSRIHVWAWKFMTSTCAWNENNHSHSKCHISSTRVYLQHIMDSHCLLEHCCRCRMSSR